MQTIIISDLEGGVRLITLNRPEKKNALTGAMYDAMRDALLEADGSEAIGADALWWSFPTGSAVTLLGATLYYIYGPWRKGRLMVPASSPAAAE